MVGRVPEEVSCCDYLAVSGEEVVATTNSGGIGKAPLSRTSMASTLGECAVRKDVTGISGKGRPHRCRIIENNHSALFVIPPTSVILVLIPRLGVRSQQRTGAGPTANTELGQRVRVRPRLQHLMKTG